MLRNHRLCNYCFAYAKKDGLEVIKEVKAKWPNIEIIALGTVWNRAPDTNLNKMAKALGASYVLEQSLNLSELSSIVNRLQMSKRIGYWDSTETFV